MAQSQTSLRDIMSRLNTATIKEHFESREDVYQHIVDLLSNLEPSVDDGITYNRKLSELGSYFEHYVQNTSELWDCMAYINDCALEDGTIATKFAAVFTTRNFTAVVNYELDVRNDMILLLERNHTNSAENRATNRDRFYNSVILLGEYYNRVRLRNDCPIKILGDSLLELLTADLSDPNFVIDTRFARVLLLQIRLNCDLLKTQHSAELSTLFYYVRRSLIMHAALKEGAKALLLMSLDFFYTRFEKLDDKLTEMYCKYLEENSDSEEARSDGIADNNDGPSVEFSDKVDIPIHTSSPQQSLSRSPVHSETSCSSDESADDNSQQILVPTKKWSEQVLEDSFERALNGSGSSSSASGNNGYHLDGNRGDSSENDERQHEVQRPDFDLRSKLSSYNPPRPLKDTEPVKRPQVAQTRQPYFDNRDSRTIKNSHRSERNPPPPRFAAVEERRAENIRDRIRSVDRSRFIGQSAKYPDNIRDTSVIKHGQIHQSRAPSEDDWTRSPRSKQNPFRDRNDEQRVKPINNDQQNKSRKQFSARGPRYPDSDTDSHKNRIGAQPTYRPQRGHPGQRRSSRRNERREHSESAQNTSRQ